MVAHKQRRTNSKYINYLELDQVMTKLALAEALDFIATTGNQTKRKFELLERLDKWTVIHLCPDYDNPPKLPMKLIKPCANLRR